MIPADPLDRRWWESRPRPALLLGAGLCLGPQGVDVLHASALELLDPIVPVALVTLGMLLPFLRRARALLMVMAPVVVAAVVMIALRLDPATADVLLLRDGRALEMCGPAVLIGVAGALFLARITSPNERRVVVLALLLLGGGLADFAAVPGLVIGLVTATVWKMTAHSGLAAAIKDVDYIFGPLAAAMLIMAGARLQLSGAAVLLAGALVIAAFVIAQPAGDGADLGVVAISVAVDLTRGMSDSAAPVVDATVIAVVVVQLLAWATARRDAPASAGALG